MVPVKFHDGAKDGKSLLQSQGDFFLELSLKQIVP
jgi:hypothetical protein